MANSRDDTARHRAWLDGQLKLASRPVFEYVSPTFVIRLANPKPGLSTRLAAVLGDGNGATLQFGLGLFEGLLEPDVAITVQCEPELLRKLVTAIALEYPGERFLHIERHEPATWYADLAAIRNEEYGL